MLAKWKQAEERWGTEGPGPWSLHFVLGVWAVEAVERGTGLRRQWAASFTSWCGVFPRGLGSWVFSPLPVSEPSSQFNCWGGPKKHIETFLGEASSYTGKAECWDWGPFILVWKEPGNSSVARGISNEQGQPLRLQASLSLTFSHKYFDNTPKRLVI